ncbi:P-loop containing nucleoside triphosphate hydrolase protein [Crucibulum laeve]|uniref:P-loop containing nucleoside triphosphate hydrolase protein n=1 Tax=Crucibulum laeve TaxID=68775 RepID=A0A5C3LYM9_9AGAR|nr:P-loop containing nucleoside triphosphate hydrolase protein [Crucibulum laeve]
MPLNRLWPYSPVVRHRQESWRILLAGDNAVGKTSFAYQCSEETFKECYDTSLQEEHLVELDCDEIPATILLLDTWVAQACDIGIDDEIIPSGHAFILMYSVTSCHSFKDIVNMYHQIRKLKRGSNPVFALIGNKCDMRSSREISFNEGAALAQELGCQIFLETSAKTGENVQLVVSNIISELRKAGNRRTQMLNPMQLLRLSLSITKLWSSIIRK